MRAWVVVVVVLGARTVAADPLSKVGTSCVSLDDANAALAKVAAANAKRRAKALEKAGLRPITLESAQTAVGTPVSFDVMRPCSGQLPAFEFVRDRRGNVYQLMVEPLAMPVSSIEACGTAPCPASACGMGPVPVKVTFVLPRGTRYKGQRVISYAIDNGQLSYSAPCANPPPPRP